MALQISKLTLADYDECLGFLNQVFSQSSKPIDFEKELPKAFRREERLVSRHWACRRDGEIRAIVGVYPMDLQVAGQTIHCATVGNVATHIEDRGSGMMKALMQEAMAELAERQIDLSRLGGERLRYNRYGYEQAGRRYRHVLTRKNARSFADPGLASHFSFQPITQADTGWLQEAFTLYRRAAAAVDRIDSQEFYCVLLAHYMQPWAVLDPTGRMVGYLTASADHRTINEQQAACSVTIEQLLFAWINTWQLDSITFWLMPWDRRYLHEVGYCCESRQIESPSMFLIRNWPRLIQAFLTLKLHSAALPDGEVAIRIDNNETLAICVESGEATCIATDRAADLALDQLTATRLIFGTLPPETVLDSPRDISCAVQAWFPLPLSWYPQDNV